MGKRLFLATLISLFTALAFTACSKDKEEGIEQGNLAGTSWSYRVTTSNSVTREDRTYKYTFTSKSTGTYSVNGWYQVSSGYIKITWGEKKRDDRAYDFTYAYDPASQIGTLTLDGRTTPEVFEISEDLQTFKCSYTNYRVYERE